MLLVPKIFFKNHSMALTLGFNLFHGRFSFNWKHFFPTEISSNLKLSHLLLSSFLFSSSLPTCDSQKISALYCCISKLSGKIEKLSRTSKLSDRNYSIFLKIVTSQPSLQIIVQQINVLTILKMLPKFRFCLEDV